VGVVLLAAVVTGSALAYGTRPLGPPPQTPGYTSLWLLPSADAPDAVRVGVRSAELRATRYRLVVSAGGRDLRTFTLRLAPGQGFGTTLLVLGRHDDVEARLYRADGGSAPYRRATLPLARPGGTAAP
jgi:hypothetical protein